MGYQSFVLTVLRDNPTTAFYERMGGTTSLTNSSLSMVLNLRKSSIDLPFENGQMGEGASPTARGGRSGEVSQPSTGSVKACRGRLR